MPESLVHSAPAHYRVSDTSDAGFLKRRYLLLLFHCVVVLSGFAGLGYQMVWSRMLAVSLGHEIAAVLAVVAAFFIGLSVGAFALNERIRRSAHPARWYIGMECSIALWALAMMVFMPAYNHWLPTLIGVDPSPLWHWGVAFCASFICLLPATAAMGATLPAMERICSRRGIHSDSVAALYASNTLGAVLGTLFSTFILIPQLGHGHTVLVLAALNGLCALAVFVLFVRSPAAVFSGLSAASLKPLLEPHAPAVGMRPSRLLITLFVTGLLGIAYEIVMVRLLSQVLENTVYTFASVLAIYLLGTALGAAFYQRRVSKNASAEWSQNLALLLVLTAISCLLGIAALWLSDSLYQSVLQLGPANKTRAVGGELLVATSVFLLPTLCMGALFSHLARRAVDSTGLGLALGFNTLGAALAPLCFGVVLLPLLGAKLLLAALVVAYLACLPKWSRGTLKYAIPVAVATALLWLGPPLRFINIADDSTILAYDEGVMASVAVVEDGSGNRHLKVNNHFTMGGTATRFSDHRQSHLPLLLHGSPHSALYLGLGTGITFEAAQFYAGMATTGVDLIPETLAVMPYFGVEPNAQSWQPAPRLLAADARRYVLSSAEQFDVIIAEIFHPSRDGAGSLYTVEQFSAIRQRLAEGGLFAQWLPLFQLDLDTLKTIVRSFLSVYPDAQMHLGHFSLQQPILCLVGRRSPQLYETDWLLNRVTDRRLQQELVKERLNSDFALFGGYLAGASALKQFAGDGPLNTDDHPVVTYSAPDFVYRAQRPPAERLIKLLTLLGPRQDRFVAPSGEDQFAVQLENYWQARDLFLGAGVGVDPAANIEQMVSQTREPLLKAVRISPVFDPAYRALLGTAQALSQVNGSQSYDLLSALVEANPQRSDALKMRQALFGH